MTRPYTSRKERKAENKKPKARLKIEKYLEGHSKEDLAYLMGISYTQIYPLLRKDANPTLSTLESVAAGLTKLRGKKVTIRELIDEK